MWLAPSLTTNGELNWEGYFVATIHPPPYEPNQLLLEFPQPPQSTKRELSADYLCCNSISRV